MSLSRSRLLRLLAALMALMIITAACSSGDDDDDSDDQSEEESEDQSEDESEDQSDDESDTSDDEGAEDTEAIGGEERDEAIQDFADEMASDAGVQSGGSAYTYSNVTDGTGQLSVDIPDQWTDFDPSPPLNTYGVSIDFGPAMVASTDLATFQTSYDVPGMVFTATSASTTQNTQAVLSALEGDQNVSGCSTVEPAQPYSDPLYTGQSQLYTDCGSAGAAFVWIAVEDIDETFIAVVGVQLLTDADAEALEAILDTFVVTPS
jgi:serine protease Do